MNDIILKIGVEQVWPNEEVVGSAEYSLDELNLDSADLSDKDKINKAIVEYFRSNGLYSVITDPLERLLNNK